MKLNTRILLSIMMFLQYFIWGAWFVTMGTFLGQGLDFSGEWIGRAYTSDAIAAIIAPFFVGFIADRFFSTEKVLGILHLTGAALIYWASTQSEPMMMFGVLLLYMICYMPTLALTNSLSFHQMQNPEKQFPGIRVLGTIGWIVAGLVVGTQALWGGESIEPTALPMQIAAGASVVMGIFCFFLPHTPPQSKGKAITFRDIIGLDALSLMKERSFLIFVIASFLICIPLKFYYVFTNLFLNEVGMENTAQRMTLGQVSEIVFMLLMPFFFVRLGVKWMLLIGMAFWAARYALFAFGDGGDLQYMLILGIVFHGICYDFFFVTGQIYVDKKAPRALRASAQGFITLVTLGFGMWIGGEVSGRVVGAFETTVDGVTSHNWQTIWLVPAAMAAVVFVFFALLFKDNSESAEKDDVKEAIAEEGPAVEFV